MVFTFVINLVHQFDGELGVASDQFGEQTFIRQEKQAGGLKGLRTKAEQVAVWTESIVMCSHVLTTLEDMYNSQMEEQT